MAARATLTPLRGSTAVVTGASRGIGTAIARSLWDAGASLLLTARDEKALHEIAAALRSTAADEQSVDWVAADLGHPTAPAKIVASARSHWARLDILVNNAAMQGPIGRFWETPAAEWSATLSVNLLAPVEICRVCVPWMIESRHGKIINLSGGGATAARPRFSAYGAAKAALARFSETLAQELRPFGVDVNCVAPGAVRTAMTASLVAAGPERAGAEEHAAAVALADDPEILARIGALCTFLASRESDGISGRLISARWDAWEELPRHRDELSASDVYTLRRIVPADRGFDWGKR